MKLELKHLAAYLPYALKCKYEGIINTKELSAHKKLEPKYVDFFDDEYSTWINNEPKHVIGKKISIIKEIKVYKKYITFHLGTYHRHLKTLFLCDIKPILRPLSDLTKEIEVDGEKFVPIDLLGEMMEIEGIGYSDYYINWNENKDISINWMIEPYFIIEKMLSWHFDIYDLIPNNLAIDINTI